MTTSLFYLAALGLEMGRSEKCVNAMTQPGAHPWTMGTPVERLAYCVLEF